MERRNKSEYGLKILTINVFEWRRLSNHVNLVNSFAFARAHDKIRIGNLLSLLLKS